MSTYDTDTLIAMLCREDGRGRAVIIDEIVDRHQHLLAGLAPAYAKRGLDPTEFERLARGALRAAAESIQGPGIDFVAYATTFVISDVRRQLREEAAHRAQQARRRSTMPAAMV